jgi:excisionase family DNA binding protein
MGMAEDYLTTKEAAERLGVTPARVRVLRKEGRLPGAVKFSRDWLFPAATIAEFKPNPKGWPAGKPRKPPSPPSSQP